jgi:hypothetical protein
MEYFLCCCPVPVVASLSYYFYQKGQEIREKRAKEEEISRVLCEAGIQLMKFGTEMILDEVKKYQSRRPRPRPPMPRAEPFQPKASAEEEDLPEWDDAGCSLMATMEITKPKNE